MNSLNYNLVWADLFQAVLWLAIVFVLILLLQRLASLSRVTGTNRQDAMRFMRRVRGFYEPLALVILSVIFVLVNPVVHGLIAGVFVILGWPLIRDYLSGRFLKATTELVPGGRIIFNDLRGTVQSLYNFSLLLQTDDGIKNIGYHQLRSQGFIIQSGTKISGFQDFLLQPQEETITTVDSLENRLFNCPYLDWQHQPEIEKVPEDNSYRIRVLIKDDTYRDSFLGLIGEWGFSGKLAK